MAVCSGCAALRRKVKRLEVSLRAMERERDALVLELDREVEAAWDLVGGVRVELVQLERPRDYPMPLFSGAEGGAA